MMQKLTLWLIALVVVAVAGGILYYSMYLASDPDPYQAPSTPTTPGAVDTTELDTEETQSTKDYAAVEASLSDYEAVDATQDDLGL